MVDACLEAEQSRTKSKNISFTAVCKVAQFSHHHFPPHRAPPPKKNPLLLLQSPTPSTFSPSTLATSPYSIPTALQVTRNCFLQHRRCPVASAGMLPNPCAQITIGKASFSLNRFQFKFHLRPFGTTETTVGLFLLFLS